jgi:hypothetical protein
MAFEATTPYALACLGDTAKAAQSYNILQQQESAEVRVQGLVELAEGWDVPMDEQEAEQVVAEYDRVVVAHAASGRGGAAFSMIAAYTS